MTDPARVRETSTISTAVMEVTPAMAAQYLAQNTRNRPARMAYVSRLADAMQRGEWHLNGEPIQIARDGTLLNGQHRLKAVVQSRVTVPLVVVTGLPLSAQDTIDTGARRRLADVLALQGETDTANLASSLSLLHRYRVGARLDNAGHAAPTPQQAIDLLQTEPHLRDSLRVGRRVRREAGLSMSIATVMHHLFTERSQEDADEFFRVLCDPSGLPQTNAIVRLRSVLDRARSQQHSYAPSVYMLSAMTIKAWNAFRDNQPIENLSFRPGGKHPEKFPVIR